MIDYISGRLKTLTPTYAVIENSGIGYMVEISLQTYDFLSGKEDCTVYIQRQVNQRDGTEVDYGFSTREERELFRSITGVSGMGASSARMILSALSPSELVNVISSGNANLLKTVKGIGLKTAQRIIVDLKDKIKAGGAAGSQDNVPGLLPPANAEIQEEAVAALTMLGFAQAASQKVVASIMQEDPAAPVEQVIKLALKRL